MKNIYLFLLLAFICSSTAYAQHEQSSQPGHIAVCIIPKGADLKEAKQLLDAIGKSMKSAEGCIAVYTSEGGIGGPMGDPDYLIMQTVHWRSNTDLFKWAGSDANKSAGEWSPLIMNTNVQMFGYNVDNSLN